MARGYIAWTGAYGMVVVAPPAMMGTPRTTTMLIYGSGAARERTCCSWLCFFLFLCGRWAGAGSCCIQMAVFNPGDLVVGESWVSQCKSCVVSYTDMAMAVGRGHERG